MIKLDEYELNKKGNYILIVVSLVSSVCLSILFYRNLLPSIAIMPFINRIKKFAVQRIMEKRIREYTIQFKDFLFMTSTAIGAGRSMKDAIKESIPELRDIYGEDSILATELTKAHQRMEIGGEDDVNVLMELAINSGIEDCVDFVTVYSICKTSGANMILALNKAASVIIDKMTIEREITELIRRKEIEGLVIFGMPFIVIIFLNLCAPDYIAPLYTTWVGRTVMTLVIASNIGIYLMIKKIVSVEI